MASGATVVLAFATIFTAIGLVFVALAFATDHWLEYSVDRGAVAAEGASAASLEKAWFFSRDRGLFRTCYDGTEAKFLDDTDTWDVVDGNCVVEDGYQLESDEEKSNWNDDYQLRIHLMRSHFGFFVFAMLMLVIGCIVGAIGCWKLSSRMIRIAGLVVFVGAFLAAGGMAFFHGYEYLERQKIDEEYPEFPAYWNEYSGNDLEALQEHSSIRYGYSYFFGWIGMGMGALAAILFLCAAYSVADRTRPARHTYDDQSIKQPYFEPEPAIMPYASKPPPGPMYGPPEMMPMGAAPMYGPEVMPGGYSTIPGPPMLMGPQVSGPGPYQTLPAVGYPGYGGY